jgi:hypothetical protein
MALIWLMNGFYCKVLHLVPRHELIVARILGPAYAHFFTVCIGCSEILMSVWIVSNISRKLNAVVQMLIIAIMNTIEFFLAADLLLWGKANALFAGMLIAIIYVNEFMLHKKIHPR